MEQVLQGTSLPPPAASNARERNPEPQLLQLRHAGRTEMHCLLPCHGHRSAGGL